MEAHAIADRGERFTAERLIGRAREGDLPAFEEIYRRHVGRIYAICLRMTADAGRAEELTQETFVRAWRGLDTIGGNSAFPAWLRRVAINLVLEDSRSRARRRAKETPMADVEYRGPAGTASPGEKMDLERAVADLPDGARRVFVLHDVEGYRHEEIGRMLGVAPGTCKAQLHRARKLLREALRS